MTNKEMEVEIEAMVDQSCLYDVLTVLADICHGKAEHLESNWQDRATAKLWEKAARLIEHARSKTEV